VTGGRWAEWGASGVECVLADVGLVGGGRGLCAVVWISDIMGVWAVIAISSTTTRL
jgi:hypothetical protein